MRHFTAPTPPSSPAYVLKFRIRPSIQFTVRFDLSSLIGLLVAGCAIVLGLKLEGGHMSSIAQPMNPANNETYRWAVSAREARASRR